MDRRWSAGAGLAVIAGIVVSVPALLHESSDAEALQPKDPQIVAEGRTLYAHHCASCHGADLEGQADWRSPGPDGRLSAPPHDASGHTWHHTDEVLFRLTKHGPAAFVD